MNFSATILICVTNPALAYFIITFFGFTENALPFFTILITVEYMSMLALRLFNVAILTAQLLIIMWLLICLHVSAFAVLALKDSTGDPYLLCYDYLYAIYPSVLMLLHCSQIFLLISNLALRISLGNKR